MNSVLCKLNKKFCGIFLPQFRFFLEFTAIFFIMVSVLLFFNAGGKQNG